MLKIKLPASFTKISGRLSPPPHSQPRESPTTHYCTVQHHVPKDPYAERMPRADCSSNTIRDSISRVAPSLPPQSRRSTRCAGGEVIALSSRRLATSIMAAMINQPSGVARSDRVAWPRRFARPFARLWRPRDSQRIGQQTNHQWWVAAALPFEPQPLPYSGG